MTSNLSKNQTENEKSEKLYLPRFCVIPLAARQDNEISDAAKIYLGELNVFTHSEGYCWATNNQLAEMKGVSVRTINNWNEELESKGFIKRETWREHVKIPGQKGLQIKSRRKIYVFETPSKKDYEVQKTALRSEVQKCALRSEVQKCAHISIEPLNGKQEDYKPAPAAVVVLSCLQELEIPQHLRLKITSQYSTDEIETAFKRCVRWKGRPGDQVGIMTTLAQADTWNDEPNKEEIVEVNESFLRSLDGLDEKTIGPSKIVIGHDYISFCFASHSKDFYVKDKYFIEDVKKYIDQCRKFKGNA